jgi:hypothetical protein
MNHIDMRGYDDPPAHRKLHIVDCVKIKNEEWNNAQQCPERRY